MSQALWLVGMGLMATLKSVLMSLYDFVLSLGGTGLFLLALGDSSFISVPEGNDLLIVILSTGQGWSRMLFYVAMTTLGSLVGCFLLYSVGRRGGDFVRRRLDVERLERAGRLYQRWGLLSILVPSMLPPPCPFKIFVLSAGVFAVPPSRFMLAVALGRSARYLTWGILAVLFGEAAKVFIQQNMHIVGLVIFLCFLGLTGILVLRQWARRRSWREAA